MNNLIMDTPEEKNNLPFIGIARTIRALREGNGWTRAQLAQKVPCSIPCIGLWESGKVLPGNSKVCRLAQLFDTSPGNLLMGLSCIEPVETETPEQVELTGRVLRDMVEPDLDCSLLPEQPLMDDSDLSGNAPAFSLVFQNDRLTCLRIAQGSEVVEFGIDEIPYALIDALVKGREAE